MNISYRWLKEYLDFDLSPEVTGDVLTNVGLEVEDIIKYETVKGGLEGLKIGVVKSVEKHPNADRLSVTKVSLGNSSDLQIVCGAPNVAEGQKVIVAPVGETLYPCKGEPFEIKHAKIRGVVSEGMICAGDEIGLSDDHSGILILPDDAEVGTWVKDFLKVETDYVFQIGLTPNRGDATSHIGVDRDIDAYLKANSVQNISLKIPSTENFKVHDHSLKIEVEVENPEACFRYSGVTISGIKVTESPEWIKSRLKAVGIRPINNIVDITNYVMLECGQPLHAFDADKVYGGKIVVKTLSANTIFRTLDDQEIKLRDIDLMICSASEGMCIAGVYGGIHSGVKESTVNIFLESACFNPKYVRRTSTFHQLRTDAALRFEKGTDPNGTIYALKRAALFIAEICGGRISSEIVDVYPVLVKPKLIVVPWEKVNRLAGAEIPRDKTETILKTIGFEIISLTEKELEVAAPTFKTDVTQSEDVIEEILRIYGFDHIAIPEQLRSAPVYGVDTRQEVLHLELSRQLAALGFNEMINNSISNSKYTEEFAPDLKSSIIRLLSYSNIGLDSMRTSMLYPALEVVRYNHNRKEFDLKLFEFGSTYISQGDQYIQSSKFILVATGYIQKESWKNPQQPVDLFYMKGLAESLLRRSGIKEYSATTTDDQQLEQSIAYKKGEETLVTLGQISGRIQDAFDIKKEVYYAEFDADLLLKLSDNKIRFSASPKFPSVRRDLAVVISRNIAFRDIEELAYRAGGELMKGVNLFDVYEDEKIGEEKKSYAISFIFQDESKTLTDAEVDARMEILVRELETNFKAFIRK